MRITQIETVPLRDGSLLLRMQTDAGIVGYGQPMSYGHTRPVAAAVDEMAEYLIGKDPRDIEDHWQVLYRSSYSHLMPILLGALSGIDIALWDILGKILQAPVWRLLGGPVRKRVRVYAGVGLDPDRAKERVAEGYTVVKMVSERRPWHFVETPAGMKRTVDAVAAIRDAVGPGMDIAIDLHRRLSPAMSKVILKELEPFGLMFAEEPCHVENTDALADLASSTSIPIATGERHATRWGFREVIERRAAAVIQPDIRHCGGISEMRRIASMAEPRDIAVAPHSGAAGGAMGVAASIHVGAAIPNFLIAEGGDQRGRGLFVEPLELRDGFVELPTGPGLGIEVDPDLIEENRVDIGEHAGRRVQRLPDDESFADM